MSTPALTNSPAPTPARKEAAAVFLQIGLLSFGGPAAQIALMHKKLVEERGWLSEQQFLNALSFCMLLPGPEAMQLATYAGWRLHGVTGGLIAGLFFVLPGAVVIFALATLYVGFGDLPVMDTLFLGIKAAVLIIVLEALLKVSRRALNETAHWLIAGFAFLGIFFFSAPFPLIILAAGVYGAVFAASVVDTCPVDRPEIETPLRRTVLIVFWGLAIWLVPILVLYAVTDGGLLGTLGVFFSKLAVVTFGGAYAVLAYISQDVVTRLGWLTADEMLDGLGLAETTPGPLILVTQFTGYIAAFREGGYFAAFCGGLITLWATFTPCFIWIFAGGPYIERISYHPRPRAALQAVTAAVVGVILNLSVWFSLHVLFDDITRQDAGPLTLWIPDIASLNWHALFVSTVAGLLILWAQLGLGWVLGISATLALLLGSGLFV
jgi:chromate transporter